MSFINLSAALWFLLPLLFLGLALYSRQNLIEMFSHLGKEAPPPLPGRPHILLILGITLCVPALMRPVSNPRLREEEQKGRNIVFVVDVSRSMLAEDLVPSRLERARYDILNNLGSFQGNRLALVAFAGSAVLKCPLTLDYSYFSQALSDLSVRSVSRGGTNLGDALRVVLDDLFDPEDRESMDIILITDGEDQDSFPLEAAARAGREGVRLIALGLGDQDQGSPVPGEEGKTMEYQNREVYSRADMGTLEAMARSSRGGWSLSVEEGKLPLPGIMNRISLEGGNRAAGTARTYGYDEHYRWFLVPGILLIGLSFLKFPGRKKT